VVIDDVAAEPEALIELAAQQPFPEVLTNSYPGLRRHLSARDPAASTYVEGLRAIASPIVNSVFGAEGFRIVQAAFSLMTKRPQEMHPLVRLPHYDSVNATRFALLHFLAPTPQGGTGFYRQLQTGIEQISQANKTAFEQAILADIASEGEPAPVFMNGSTRAFEQIGFFEGRFNRLLIYSGALLHSAHVPEDFTYSADPRAGRLTTNLFLQA